MPELGSARTPGRPLREVRQLRAEIDIDAPPERVWAVLTDLPAYPQWNPFIRRISGELREGASERFSGFLVGLFKGTLAKTEVGFEQMNAELKARVERPSAQN